MFETDFCDVSVNGGYICDIMTERLYVFEAEINTLNSTAFLWANLIQADDYIGAGNSLYAGKDVEALSGVVRGKGLEATEHLLLDNKLYNDQGTLIAYQKTYVINRTDGVLDAQLEQYSNIYFDIDYPLNSAVGDKFTAEWTLEAKADTADVRMSEWAVKLVPLI